MALHTRSVSSAAQGPSRGFRVIWRDDLRFGGLFHESRAWRRLPGAMVGAGYWRANLTRSHCAQHAGDQLAAGGDGAARHLGRRQKLLGGPVGASRSKRSAT